MNDITSEISTCNRCEKENNLDDQTLSENGFGGIWLLPNLIYISEDGIMQIYDFYKSMINFLISLD